MNGLQTVVTSSISKIYPILSSKEAAHKTTRDCSRSTRHCACSGEERLKPALTVIAYVTAKSGHEKKCGTHYSISWHTAGMRKGCTNYDLHESQESPGEFAIYVNWNHTSDLEAHTKSGHLQEFRRIISHRWKVHRRSQNGVWSRNWVNTANPGLLPKCHRRVDGQ